MSTNSTNEILRQALHACADATDKIVPGKGQQLKDFADELYGNEEKNTPGDRAESPLPAQVEGLTAGLLPCPFCGNHANDFTMCARGTSTGPPKENQ